jgi:ureidoglycolate lyase
MRKPRPKKPPIPSAKRQTGRQELRALLEGGPWRLEALRRQLGLTVKDLESELDHLDRSLRREKRSITVEPAECLSCGRVLAPRSTRRFHAAGRCPHCKSERVADPSFSIERATVSLRTITALPLSVEAFAPFGDVVSAGLKAGSSANQGTAVRFDWSAELVSLRPSAKPNLAVFRASPQALPFTVRLLEKHPASSQAFLPLVCTRFLVCVAPRRSDGEPELDRLEAFVCGPGQGINYHANVWHHPIIALDTPAELAMLAWEDGSSEDCVEHHLPAKEHVLVTV